MKKIVDYLPLLSICLIYFGFCNLHAYYKEFQIDIYVYITTTEIIMAFFPTMVFVSGIVSTSLIQEFVGKPSVVYVTEVESIKEANTSKTKKFMTWLFKSFITWLIIMVAIQITIRWTLKEYFGYQSYDFQELNLYLSAFMLVGLIWFLVHTNRMDSVRNKPVVVAISIVCYIGMQISTYRKLDADRIKAGIAQHQLSFRYHSKPVATGKQLMFIGQTTGNLFLYDRKRAKTLVFKTSDIDSLVINN